MTDGRTRVFASIRERLAERSSRFKLGAIAGSAIALVLILALVATLFHGDGASFETRAAHPGQTCVSPPPLLRYRGVVLKVAAMRAFKKAEASLGPGARIKVDESYRTCDEQRAACQNICGHPKGCPNLCAEPGSSMHQMGAAIDLKPSALRDPAVVAALQEQGWCQPLPQSDAGHFSYGQCR